MSFEIAVQTAIYSQLTGSAPLMSAVVDVYDDVPQPDDSGYAADFPYVTIGEDVLTATDTDAELSNSVSITVHTWSRESGKFQTKTIQGLIYNALNRASLIYLGYNFVNISRATSDSFLESDGQTRHGVQTFNILIEEV